jgi:hypothetical protein
MTTSWCWTEYAEPSLSRETVDDPIVNTNWNAEHPAAALIASRYRASKDKDARLVLKFPDHPRGGDLEPVGDLPHGEDVRRSGSGVPFQHGGLLIL